jgi:hypothetical protein
MKNKALLIYRVIAASVAVFSVSYRLFINPMEGTGLKYFIYQLGFFSMQSAILTAAIFVLLVINQLRGRSDTSPPPAIRGAALLYGLITSLLFAAFFMDKMNAHGFSRIILYINHVGLTVMIMIDNIVSIKPGTHKWDLLIYWMIFPFYNLVLVLVESYIFHQDRYYFLVLNDINSSFFPFILLLLSFIFIITAILIIFVNKILKVKEDTEILDI